MNLDFLKNLFAKKRKKIVKVKLEVIIKTSEYGANFISKSARGNLFAFDEKGQYILFPYEVKSIKII